MARTRRRAAWFWTLVALVVGFLVLRDVASRTLVIHCDCSLVVQAEQQMDVFHRNIQLFRAEKGRLPDTLEELCEVDAGIGEPWMERIPDDPWGSLYAYRRAGDGTYGFVCAGPDGEKRTEDDISWPRPEDR